MPSESRAQAYCANSRGSLRIHRFPPVLQPMGPNLIRLTYNYLGRDSRRTGVAETVAQKTIA